MTFRRAAALVFVGWYLMAPPHFRNDKSPFALDRSAPLSRWALINSFDTAAACKAEVRRLMDSPIETVAAIGDDAQCIASDDPRLKGN